MMNLGNKRLTDNDKELLIKEMTNKSRKIVNPDTVKLIKDILLTSQNIIDKRGDK